MGDIKKIQKTIIEFRDKREWKQFHNPKDIAISLLLEATEVLEHFQWKSPTEIDNYLVNNKDKIGEELADTLYWTLLMAHDLVIDLEEAFNNKMLKNEQKYSVEKAKGNHKKYTELN